MIFKNDSLDPAAVFSCAVSLRDACEQSAKMEKFDLSDAFNGLDQFFRELMRIACLFEEWSCKHVAFDEMYEVWPYLLEDKFGAACLQRMSLEDLKHFDAEDCPLVAMNLLLPLHYQDEPRLPLDVTVVNPVPASPFTHWRIQTLRCLSGDDAFEPMCYGDDPSDPEYETSILALYGVNKAGLIEHIKDFTNYADAVAFAVKIAPGVEFPVDPLVMPRG
ncbi:hypothetical protein [Prosthecobacter vanneervenii]|uniref:Uncharacterized protein n=1 Tax=Prosthecobacter vanneervenii TaxID=48466 RepID=A0A7W7YC01_9BACT|nr:hypothetical protein [Prosthecobacter vanneervenii]MBB5033339.1 hypothetical protein [Prosthecobacter vanneervenii]